MHRWRTLTAEVADRTSPLRLHLDERFPHRKELRDAFAASSGSLLVDTRGGNAGTIGTTFDLAVRMMLDSQHVPMVALATRVLTDDERDSLLVVLGEAASASRAGDTLALARACSALALGVEAYRLGAVAPGSPLARLRTSRSATPDNFLAATGGDQVGEVAELLDLASVRLLPHLPDPLVLGPRFAASRVCRADADLVARTTLIELKVKLGRRNPRTGVRRDVLDQLDLLQVIAYALFDLTDQYSLTDVTVYSARYGTLWTLPLSDMLSGAAGRKVVLAEERTAMIHLLGLR